MSELHETRQVTCDVSGIQPIAQENVRLIAWTYHKHLGPDLITLLAHGSAVKGGIIEGSSDVDCMAFVTPGILTAGGQLPLERALALHRDLACIDPAPFRYLQGVVYAAGSGPLTGFIPGTFQIVTGSPDVPLATSEDLLAAADLALGQLDPSARQDRLSNALLDHGEERLFRQVRWLCTDVWPIMYQVASLHMSDGIQAWQCTKPEIVAILGDDPGIGPPLSRWMNAITHHYASGESVESALEAVRAGMAFIDAAAGWHRERPRCGE